MPTIPVVAGGPDRQIHVTELLVAAHPRPHVRVARVAPGLVLPGFDLELLLLGDGVEDPLHLAGADVVAAHVARRHLPGQPQVVDDRPKHDRAAADGRWRLHVVVRTVDVATESQHEVHVTVLAEVAVEGAGFGVQREELHATRGEHDALLTGAVTPVRHTAAGQPTVCPRLEFVGLRVEHPLELAGTGVERDHLVQRGTDVEAVADLHRGGTEATRGLSSGGVHRSGVPTPFHPQVRDVVRVDLVERRVLGAVLVARVRPPLSGRILGEHGHG